MWTLIFLFGWSNEPLIQVLPFFETKEACVQAAQQFKKAGKLDGRGMGNSPFDNSRFTCVPSK